MSENTDRRTTVLASIPALDRLLRIDEVRNRVGLGTSAIYRRMAAGTFPAARQLGPGCVRWRESEIREWMDNLPAAVPAKTAGKL